MQLLDLCDPSPEYSVLGYRSFPGRQMLEDTRLVIIMIYRGHETLTSAISGPQKSIESHPRPIKPRGNNTSRPMIPIASIRYPRTIRVVSLLLNYIRMRLAV